MQSVTCSLKATRFVLLAITIAYFFVPVVVYPLVGDDFYVYSSRQSQTIGMTVIFGIATSLFVLGVTRSGRAPPVPGETLLYQLGGVYYITLAHATGLAIYGAYLRGQGLDRFELLEAQTALLFPGFGPICLLGCVHAIFSATWRKLLLLTLVFVLTDIMFMGKIFTFIAAGALAVRWDRSGRDFRLLHAIVFVFAGALFVASVYALRALSGDQSVLIDFYTFFSEFIGVQASVGWAMQFYGSTASAGGASLFNFVLTLDEYYYDIVGHGLALSPVAYFYGLFGPLWLPLAASYLLLAYVWFRVAWASLGYVALFLLAYNYQHLMRHGVDIFTMKVLTQTLFLVFVLKLIPSAMPKPAERAVSTVAP